MAEFISTGHNRLQPPGEYLAQVYTLKNCAELVLGRTGVYFAAVSLFLCLNLFHARDRRSSLQEYVWYAHDVSEFA